jgi:hypothetical protein
MKFLFITGGSSASVFAIAPLATAVRNAGHEILLAANEPLMEAAEAVGVPAVSITPEPLRHFMLTDRSGNACTAPELIPAALTCGWGGGPVGERSRFVSLRLLYLIMIGVFGWLVLSVPGLTSRCERNTVGNNQANPARTARSAQTTFGRPT